MRALITCSNAKPTEGFSSTVRLARGQVATVHAECPAGHVLTGGGGSASPDVLFNSAAPTATGWTVRATNTGFDSRDNVWAMVLCTAP
ncbi:hypothetical protein [Streptomyces sp. NPDC091371]|uniref:hypothetical protein n=1 Tax=Streptomyces sp. NPDC091371 TaxID=3155303 RepID=UPI003412A6D7